MKKLNSNQIKAIEVIDKPLIVVAGPGTGKTTLITEKIDYLIKTKKIPEDKILALTFTQKAASEMTERLINLSEGNKNFVAKTFHSFALDLIEKYSKKISQIDKNFILIEDKDQLLFFLENLDDFNIQSVEIKNNRYQIASELKSTIMKIKEFSYSILDLEKVNFPEISQKLDIFSAFSKYENYKRKNNFLDFSDLLLYLRDLLIKSEIIRKEIQDSLDYILIDEFQDTNKIQLEIIELISKSNGNNITIVGDQKQSIYSFRGANFSNIDLFKKKYNNFEEIYLNENYRSSKFVLDNVNKLTKIIANEKEILNLNSNEIGEVRLFECSNEYSQFGFMIEEIKNILDENKNVKIGILTRRKLELKLISEKLKEFNIEHDSSSFENLFEVEIIKDLISILKIINNPKESNNEIFKLLFELEIRPETIRKISRKSSLKEKSLFKVLDERKNISEFESEDEIIYNFYERIIDLIKLKNSKVILSVLIKKIIEDFNLYNKVLISDNKLGVFALNNFINFTSEFILTYKKNNLNRFLEVINLTKDIQISIPNENDLFNVELNTIHNSKGKEYDYVFIPYLNDKRFPISFKKSIFETEFDLKKEEFIEEEKRLFFVGLSRAKKSLYLSYVKKFSSNKLDSKQSSFLNFLDLEKEKYNSQINLFENEVSKSNIKIEIIKKINSFLLENKFDLAKKEIDLFQSLFETKKSLNSFINLSHPDLEIYKKRLENKKNSNCNYGKNLDLDMSKQIYSVSQLKTYEQCPKKYLFSYIYKIPSTPKQYFDFGTSIHEVLENIAIEINPDINVELFYAKSINLLHKVWISKGYESAKQEREYFEKGCRTIRDFILKEIEIKSKEEKREIIGREKTFTINLEGRKIYGIIDRVDKLTNSKGEEFMEILDYKTSNSMENQTMLKKSIQLLVYAMAAKELFNKYPEKVGLWYLIHNKILSVKFEEENLLKVKKEILNLMKGVESQDFRAKPSLFNCKFCDYSNICENSFK